MRVLQLVHAIPGRTRLLASWTRRAQAEAEALAEALAAVAGVREVRARTSTGSLVVTHAPELDPARLVEAARAQGNPAHVLGPGDAVPLPPGGATATSSIARTAARLFGELNRDVLRATGGRADLGVLATLGFFTAGAVEIGTTGQMPVPPWFNLAWWGFRTFLTTEEGAIVASRDGREEGGE